MARLALKPAMPSLPIDKKTAENGNRETESKTQG